MRTRHSLIFASGFLLLAIAAMPGCSSAAKDPKPTDTATPSAAVATVKRGSISLTLSLAGQFQAYQVVDVHPKVSGFIRKIYVDIGDKVHKGETLAVLEIPELEAQLQGSVSEVAQRKDEITRAQHELTGAKSEYSAVHADDTRLQAAAKAQPGLIAQQELDDAQAKDLAAGAQVDAAEAALSAAQNGADVSKANNRRFSALQGYTNVVAPFDGVVIARDADTGALIQSGTGSDVQSLAIVKLAESGILRLRMPVPEDAVKYVREGDAMQIRVDALGRSFTGKVVRFTRNLSPDTRTMETEVDLPNKDLSIDPGMYANAQLQLAHVENVLTAPVAALVEENGKRVVYVVDAQNRVQIRDVQAGLQGSLLAEIKTGLAESDRVIVADQQRYQQGEAVDPVLQNSPASDVTRQAGGMIDLHDDQGDEQ
ncbi:MAG TPA: efflux RND transporter periplasmic adaptor subunit [Silvibacterium sp.]|nr:efflux RND transporter periplasmic adaptor subunit [Silvibacterium sp.]